MQLNPPKAVTVCEVHVWVPGVAPLKVNVPIFAPGVYPVPVTVTVIPAGPCWGDSMILGVVIVNVANPVSPETDPMSLPDATTL